MLAGVNAAAQDFAALERMAGDGVIVATKGGHTRTADGGWELDGSP